MDKQNKRNAKIERRHARKAAKREEAALPAPVDGQGAPDATAASPAPAPAHEPTAADQKHP